MIKKILFWMVPSSYRNESGVMVTILKWTIVGLIIRFILMPITTHSDLISIYGRAFYIIEQGDFSGMLPLLSHFLHVVFLIIIKPFMTYSSEIWQWASGRLGVNDQIWMNFIIHPNIYRTLFLLKAPYLLFDLASAVVLLHLFKDKKKGLRAFKFWMINPVAIFAVYIFGRFQEALRDGLKVIRIIKSLQKIMGVGLIKWETGAKSH